MRLECSAIKQEWAGLRQDYGSAEVVPTLNVCKEERENIK
jgi:hypothetical protein